MMERAEPPLFLFQLFMLFRRVKTVGICGFQGLTTKRFTVNYQEIYGQSPRTTSCFLGETAFKPKRH